jgi:hypothetical protein
MLLVVILGVMVAMKPGGLGSGLLVLAIAAFMFYLMISNSS